MNDFELSICSFPFKRWKVGWCNQGVNDVSKRLDRRREGFGYCRPHATSASGADGNVGVRVLSGKGEERADWTAIDVENMLCTR